MTLFAAARPHPAALPVIPSPPFTLRPSQKAEGQAGEESAFLKFSRNKRNLRPRPFPAGARILARMFTRLGCSGRPPHFVAEFYPYAGLAHTIRLRGDFAYVRFSDLMHSAPARALESAAAVLLARLYRRRLPADLRDAYREYSLAQHTRRRAQQLRRHRARRVTLAPRGNFHDLAPLFDQLNQRYFESALRRPHIGWSARPWRRQLGCFDPALDQIVLSSRLDRPGVPRCVVEYVLYHEMLHVKYPVRRAPRSPVRNTPAACDPARRSPSTAAPGHSRLVPGVPYKADASGARPSAAPASEISNLKSPTPSGVSSRRPSAAPDSEISNFKSPMPSGSSRLPRAESTRCGLQIHSPAFRAEERRFAHYAQARRLLLHLR